MRLLKPFVLAAALVAAPAADAQSICDAIQNAAKIGASDNHFAAYRREMPTSPEGYDCRINIKSRFGAYACSTPVEPEVRVARTRALLDAIRTCVAPSLIVEKNPREANAVFMISRSPNTWVIVNGADDATRIYMNVVVDRPSSSKAASPEPSSGGSSSQILSGYGSQLNYGEAPFDPRVETPHFPAVETPQ